MKGKKLSVASWFSKAEWKQAYEDLYSENVQRQARGYQRLLTWRARVPVLPASIECTLRLVQATLKDQEVAPHIHGGKLPGHMEEDLRLMYSTAIMRFLNHLSSIAQTDNETLFSMAKKLHLPEWMVSLRHDTAHGFSLPFLEQLRPAANIALDWLHVHYWKSVAETSMDWVVGEFSTPNDLTELMDCWQALKLHALGGYKMVQDLPDEDLRSYVLEMQEASVLDRMKLQVAISLLYRKVLTALKKYKRSSKLNELVDSIVTRESFIPSASCINLVNDSLKVRADKDCLPPWLFDLWKDLLSLLQRSCGLLPLLVCRLLKLTTDEAADEHQRLMAALWVKELCRGLEKGRELLDKVKQFMRRKKNPIRDKLFRKHFKLKVKKAPEPKLSTKLAWKMIKSQLEEQDPSWKNVLSLQLNETPGSICSNTALKELLLKPNSYTLIYLPSLLELMVPALSPAAKDNLLALVRIYTREPDVDSCQQESETDPVHTVQELMSLEEQRGGETQAMEVETETLSEERTHMGLERCQDDEQWSKCPLGVLPWQRGKDLTLDMPEDISWQPREPTKTYARETNKLPSLFHRKIDWTGSVRKRPKRKKKLNARFIQKAFDLASTLRSQ